MIPEVAQTPVEVVSTLLAIFLGKQGVGVLKTWLFAEYEARVVALETRIADLEKRFT